MTVVWDAEHGWHDTDKKFKLILIAPGKVKWVEEKELEDTECENCGAPSSGRRYCQRCRQVCF